MNVPFGEITSSTNFNVSMKKNVLLFIRKFSIIPETYWYFNGGMS